MFKKIAVPGVLILMLLACAGITYATVTQTFVSSKGEKSTHTFVIPSTGSGTTATQDISGASWVGIASKGITADSINVQLSPHPEPPVAEDWFTLTDNVGVNPFAADNNFWQQSVVGARAIRLVRAGAADGDITITLTLKK